MGLWGLETSTKAMKIGVITYDTVCPPGEPASETDVGVILGIIFGVLMLFVLIASLALLIIYVAATFCGLVSCINLW